MELLDDALARAAQSTDEPVEQNFVRKHYLEIPWARYGEVVGKYQGPLIGVEWSGSYTYIYIYMNVLLVGTLDDDFEGHPFTISCASW